MSVSHNPLTLLKGFCGSVDNCKCFAICPASFGARESCRKSSCNLVLVLFFFFFFKFETRSHYAALAGLRLTVICLPLPTGCWDEKAFATKPSDTGFLLERCLG